MKILAIIIAWLIGCAAAAPDHAVVERELRHQYDALAAATDRRDVEAVLAFRAADFHVTGPDGRHLDAEEMEGYTRRWFEMNRPPIDVHFTIRDVRVDGDEATVTVLQEGSRRQEVAGVKCTVAHSVIQDETWRKTPAGWRIASVENVHDQRRWVDGKRVDPTKPFDPDAPAFVDDEPGDENKSSGRN
jgi:ketosteroid isomerase-like protein